MALGKIRQSFGMAMHEKWIDGNITDAAKDRNHSKRFPSIIHHQPAPTT